MSIESVSDKPRKARGTDRLPPHNIEAEQGVLGCILLSASSYDHALEKKVAPIWFYDLRHQTIWEAFGRCKIAKHEITIDLINVQEALRQMDRLEQVGGIAYLSQLQDAVPSAANLDYYLDIIREKWLLRQLITACSETVGKVFDYEGTAESMLLEIGNVFDKLTLTNIARSEAQVRHILHEKVIPKFEAHYARGHQHLNGLPTGLTYLDKILRGVAPHDYLVIAGRPGDGKTSLAMNIAKHVATKYVWKDVGDVMRTGAPVGVFSLEMTGDSLVERLVFEEAGVSSARFEQGFATQEDFGKLAGAVERLGKANIIVDDEADQTIDVIAAKARRWVKEYGVKLFVLDYLQLLDDGGGRNENRAQEIRKISKKIVSLKKKLNVPWIVLAQMNRNIETTETPRPPVLSDLKESGAIEQDADVVLFLYKPTKPELDSQRKRKDKDGTPTDDDYIQTGWGDLAWDEQPRRVNALVAKHRDGPTGKAELIFQKNLCKFMDWRDVLLAKGLIDRGAGERDSANPVMQEPPEGNWDEVARGEV